MNKTWKYALTSTLLILIWSVVCAGQTPKPEKAKYVEYDAAGNVPIGTAGTGSKLAVGGVIESTSGGIKFPDGTTQTSSGINAVVTNSTLTGKGTSDSPLGVAVSSGGPATQPFYAKRNFTNGILTTVPAGKRLIVEYVTASFAYTSIYTHPPAVVQLSAGTNDHWIPSTMVRPAIDNGTYFYVGSQVKIYVEAGQTLSVFFAVGTDSFSREIQVTGHFVDVP